MDNFSCHLPLNSLSFGNVSIAILREFYKKGLQPCIFPIGNQADLSSQKIDLEFNKWLQSGLNKCTSSHKRTNPTFKLWHLDGSLDSYSKKQLLFSFYELDSPTKEEINIAKNNDHVLFSSTASTNVFKDMGLSNISSCPLGFDSFNFNQTNKKYFHDGRIVFNLVGKLEKRKHHAKIIRAWIKKYGNNPKYFLQCAIYNPFLRRAVNGGQIVDENTNFINQIVEGKKYFNVNFLGFMAENNSYNEFLNSANIIIGMSGGEGWGLPEFHSVAMGKHAIILNASAYKDWATKDNSILVNPSNKIEVFDEIFFKRNHPFNQGMIYDFDDDDFINACEQAIKNVTISPINSEGFKLQEKFTYQKTSEIILDKLSSLV